VTENNLKASQSILFFDGVCHLCNGFVDFVIQNETSNSDLIFAPLQGETAAKYLELSDRQDLNSVVLWSQGKALRQSDAVLEILRHLRFPWKLIGILGPLVPARFRNWCYQKVAQHRYQLFGTREFCRIPLPHERDKLWP
jgi:predicted DCC family thiol-disulfide oxidoreductase YuxK